VYTEHGSVNAPKKAKAFKSGNSIAIRVPKSLGIEEGSEWSVREERGEYVFKKLEKPSDKIDLTGIWGAIPDLKPLQPEDRLMEPRDLDWNGKLLKRD
jgi:antitoxin VapB